MIYKAFEKRLSGGFRYTQNLSNLHGYQVGIGGGSERDKPDAILEIVDEVASSLHREASLARTTRAGKCEQCHIILHQQVTYCSQLLVAPDERATQQRQVVRPGVQCLERREVGTKSGTDHLVDMLRLDQVFEAVLAQIAEFHIQGREVLDQRIC